VPGAPECPDHLDAVAKKEWNRLSEVLVAMKVLTEADYIALGNLCQAYCTLIDAQKHLNKDGQQTSCLCLVEQSSSLRNHFLMAIAPSM
jgi:P27 family predicted phage terminase small subunit